MLICICNVASNIYSWQIENWQSSTLESLLVFVNGSFHGYSHIKIKGIKDNSKSGLSLILNFLFIAVKDSF